jgi:hypothetical protein
MALWSSGPPTDPRCTSLTMQINLVGLLNYVNMYVLYNGCLVELPCLLPIELVVDCFRVHVSK